jgi:hypothetical protein
MSEQHRLTELYLALIGAAQADCRRERIEAIEAFEAAHPEVIEAMKEPQA